MDHPERLGKYRITGVLGEGAMGVVYRGFDPDIRRLVALKTIRRQPGDAGGSAFESAARFRNEAQAAGRLQHPGIVSVYDYGDDGRVAYIAMEFVDGRTLAYFLGSRLRLDDADIASIAGQVLDALAHAHEHGVWHRDVKPSNVMITPQGRAKIADFGIARFENSGLTMAQTVLGTPMYMAPEQFTGRAIDHRVDLYAAGVLLYQLVAGRPPFVGAPEVLSYKVVHELPPPPSSLEGARSARFDAVLARALAKDPAQRFVNAAAFRDALAEALGQAIPGTVSPGALPALGDAYAPTERIPTGVQAAPPPTHAGLTGTGLTGEPPTHFEPEQIAAVEAALARHVGPLAKVMVRRTARQCPDVPALVAALASQITSAAAREAFLGSPVARGPGTSGSLGTHGALAAAHTGTQHPAAAHRTGSTGTATAMTPPIGLGTLPVGEAWLEQARKLLLAHVGPIAGVMVKRASERTRDRASLIRDFAAAVPESQRAALVEALEKLG
ncbi:MAG: protein kinase [Burkholderiaceae bacterium]|nr:protein kinase [Rhodoferax sp.]MCP5285317.1 protein kinase [Burkholderiaceae bacterium]